MIEHVVGPGEVGGHLPSDTWVLVFGGVSREGNRRARRAAAKALDNGFDVVWMDGYAEVFKDDGGHRVPLDTNESGAVVIVDYSIAERAHFLNRMVQTIPDSLVAPVAAIERRLHASSAHGARQITQARRGLVAMMRKFRKKLLRRISQVFRGMVGWRVVRSDVQALAVSAPPPTYIVFGDDFALTQAWHAARIWTESPVGTELKIT